MTNYQKLSVFAVLFAFTFVGLQAQQTTGTISGVVKDETGAVLPGVEVTSRNTGTEATRTAISDDEGRYRLPQLAPGEYELRAELAGFQTAVLQNISLSVGQTAVLGVTLQVGEISEQVVVSAEVALVDTTSGSVSALVDTNQIRDLPLNARSFVELAALQEGVIIPPERQPGNQRRYGAKDHHCRSSSPQQRRASGWDRHQESPGEHAGIRYRRYAGSGHGARICGFDQRLHG